MIVSQGGNAGLMEVFGQVGCAFGNVVVVSFTTSIAVANGQGEQPAHGHCHHSYSCQSYPVRELGVVSGRIGALDLTGFNLVLRGTGGTRREMSNPHGQRNVFFKDEWWRPDREHLLLMEDYGLMTTAERAERFVFVDDPLEIEFA